MAKGKVRMICQNDSDQPYPSENPFRSEWKAAWKRSGLESERPGFRLYDVRHTFATHDQSRNKDRYITKQLLGHKSIKTTQKDMRTFQKTS